MSNMITLSEVAFRYAKQGDELRFDLTIAAGEKVAVVGASGAGKSTLLNLIAGFLQPQQGDIFLDGKAHTRTKPYQRPVSMLFQSNNLFNHLTLSQNIGIGIAPDLKLSATQRQAVAQIAEQVGLADYLSRYPDKLSGGQQQRVALARCMLRDKPILLLDEPFSALDKALRMDMLALLDRLCRQKHLTVMMVTHQAEEVTDFVGRVIEVGAGQGVAI